MVVRWTQGRPHGLVWGHGLAVVSADVDAAAVGRLWAEFAGGGDLTSFLKLLSASAGVDLLSLPEFAIALRAPGHGWQLAARGGLEARVGDDAVRGTGISTWAELFTAAAGPVSVGLPGAEGGSRPIVAGLVPASLLQWEAGAVDPSALPERPGHAAGVPPRPPVAPVVTPPVAPVVTPPVAPVVTPPSPVEAPPVAPIETSPVVVAPEIERPAPALPVPPAPVAPPSAPAPVTLPEPAPRPPDSADPAPEAPADDAAEPDARPVPAAIAAAPADGPTLAPDMVVEPPLGGVPNPDEADAPPVRAGSAVSSFSPGAGRFARQFGETQSIVVERAAVRESPEELFISSVPKAGAAPAAQAVPVADVVDEAGDHDGHTVIASPAAGSVGAAAVAPTAPVGPEGPTVLAVRCTAGHANPPHRSACTLCGAAVEGESARVPRPSLGRVLLPNGERVELVVPLIIGRNPRADRVPGSAPPRLVPLSQSHVSGSHLELRLEDWNVLAVDLNSTNGTFLRRQGEAPVRLGERPELLVEGDVLDLGHGVQLAVEQLR